MSRRTATPSVSPARRRGAWTWAAAVLALLLAGSVARAHGVDDPTRQFLETVEGPAVVPFLYIGAKHMVTGYDHLLFLVGVLFFLRGMRDVLVYVSWFTVGHSLTLLVGVLAGIRADAYLVDAVIGLSIVYKGFDNLGGFRRVLGFQPDTKAAVLVFGLCHGFGLATKLQEFAVPERGLLANLVSFNVGVELGQFTALTFVLIGLALWRRRPGFTRHAWTANVLLMSGGLVLAGYQLTGYLLSRGTT